LEGDPVYDVFDADGRWLGAVHIPRELGAIVSIGEEFVVMRFIDELGVQYVTRTEYGRIKCGTYLAARRAAGLNPVTA
jgi:hypothetical protein